MGIGGVADAMVFPTSTDELQEIMTIIHNTNCVYGVVGNGSNILFADSGFRGVVIKMRDMNAIEQLGNQKVRVDAGALNQVLIRSLHQWNLGGFEYLYSVPGTLGGAIYMNAGRGSGPTIADHIVCVDVLISGSIKTLSKEECQFSHRNSVFHTHTDWIICSAVLQLDVVPEQEGVKKRRDRLEFVKRSQNKQYPNLGTIFKKNFSAELFDVQPLKVGGAQVSPINKNWICNVNNASEHDVRALMEKMQDVHRVKDLEVPIPEIELFNERYS